jgi:hypothetical protein
MLLYRLRVPNVKAKPIIRKSGFVAVERNHLLSWFPMEQADALFFTEETLKAQELDERFVSRFGSHFSLHFTPAGRGILPVGLGPINARLPLLLGMEVMDCGYRTLPLQYPGVFCSKLRVAADISITQSIGGLICTDNGNCNGISMRWKVHSPFYPQDPLFSSMPGFFITAEIHNASGKSREVRVFGGLEQGPTGFSQPESLIVNRFDDIVAAFRGPETKSGRLFQYEHAIGLLHMEGNCWSLEDSAALWNAVGVTASIPSGASIHVEFILTSYLRNPDPVHRHGRPCSFPYQHVWESAIDIVQYYRDHHESIIQKSAVFEQLFSTACLPEHIKTCIARNFHVFLGSTWWLKEQDGTEFFTNYEGGTGYFSTLDVEYNLSLFYLQFWPQLLKSQFDIWLETYEKGNKYRPHTFGPTYRIMEHDVGGGFSIDEQVYIPGPMPVEENANFIIMQYLYYRFTGDSGPFTKARRVCMDLADYILQADTNGNGLPNSGTNNTLDCFDTLLRDMGDQLFLGLKAATALDFLADLLEEFGGGVGESYRAGARRIHTTVETIGWNEDHYVITVSKTKPQGWDGASALTTSGIAPYLFVGKQLPIAVERIRQDLHKTLVDYTMWPSMGIWRDMYARYLGFSSLGSYDFRPDFINDMYPRSFNSVGMLFCYAGISFDIPNGRIAFQKGVEGDFPLPVFADWENRRVPVLRIEKDSWEIVSRTPSLERFSIVAMNGVVDQ